jgi:hypothetical protein
VGHFSTKISVEKFQVCHVVFLFETLTDRRLEVRLMKYQSAVKKIVSAYMLYMLKFNRDVVRDSYNQRVVVSTSRLNTEEVRGYCC